MKIMHTPEWFLTTDIIIGLFSLVVLVSFTYLCLRCYHLNCNKRFFNLGISFGLVALSHLIIFITKGFLYFDFSFARELGTMIVQSGVARSVDIIFYLSIFLSRFFMLLGFYFISKLPLKEEKTGDVILVSFLFILLSAASRATSFLFHITILFLLGMAAKNYYYVYKERKHTNTKYLLSSFIVLFIGNLFFIFSTLSIMYVISDFIELIGYLLLLIIVWRIIHNGKKKKQNGNNLRHAPSRVKKRRKS